MLPTKLDAIAANQIRRILSKLNEHKRVTIDLDNDTVEPADIDDYSVDDLLESAGVLTPDVRGMGLMTVS